MPWLLGKCKTDHHMTSRRQTRGDSPFEKTSGDEVASTRLLRICFFTRNKQGAASCFNGFACFLSRVGSGSIGYTGDVFRESCIVSTVSAGYHTGTARGNTNMLCRPNYIHTPEIGLLALCSGYPSQYRIFKLIRGGSRLLYYNDRQ